MSGDAGVAGCVYWYMSYSGDALYDGGHVVGRCWCGVTFVVVL